MTRLAITLLILISACGCGVDPTTVEQHDPWVIRTSFSDDASWSAVRKLISAPQRDMGQEFYAYVQFMDDQRFANLTPSELVHSLPDDYPGFFCFVVDSVTLTKEDHPILVIGFSPNSVNVEDYQRTPNQTPLSEIQMFRAIPETIQSIENNLSIANMDFKSFADSVDSDGVFRGFPR